MGTESPCCSIVVNSPRYRTTIPYSSPFTFASITIVLAGASIFSDKVVAQWKQAEEDMFGHDPAMLKWAREGGEYAPVES